MDITALLSWLAAALAALLGRLYDPATTLSSLQQVDPYPLYTMTYYGDYEANTAAVEALAARLAAAPQVRPAWGCSLFTTFSDAEHTLYGRNFDWEFSPAVLLFTDPPDGYASVSMVDIAYLDLPPSSVTHLTDLSLAERAPLLYAPYLPFDGMNKHGLAIGMAAVDPGGMQPDPAKATIGSLGVIREILDHARTVDEAVALIARYNIDFSGGPPLHYLIADLSGQAALVEFSRGEMHVIANETPWHLATNFLRTLAGDNPQGWCWRYDRIAERLAERNGQLTAREAMTLLEEVSQPITQWSIVYQMLTGEINVVMGRDYAEVHTFHLPTAGE